MRTLGAALAAALGLGLPGLGAVVYGPRITGMGGHQPRHRGPKTKTARERIPKAFRQYAKRYGNIGPEDVLAKHAQFRALPLDHWRDRGMATHKALGMPVDPNWRKVR